MTGPQAGLSRIAPVDWARSAAILGMVAFHFVFDLRMLGMLPPGTVLGPWFDWWARIVAGSFLMLAGLSLWLAHGDGFRWRGFLRRLGILVVAALAVSLATYLVMPQVWVRFGILHAIALGSVLALPFLRLPWWISAGAAGAILWLGPGLRSPTFDGPWWLWSGLGTAPPPMMDYEPMVPWLAPVLAGVALGRLGTWLGWLKGLAAWSDGLGAWAGRLGWPGRHSLAIYLVHQPLMIGVLTGIGWLMR